MYQPTHNSSTQQSMHTIINYCLLSSTISLYTAAAVAVRRVRERPRR